MRISVPKSRVIRRPATQPKWDTEYGRAGGLFQFFRSQVVFIDSDAAASVIGRRDKWRSDCNMNGAFIVGLHEDAYALERVVLYPSWEGVQDVNAAAYRAAVEDLRQTSMLLVKFGDLLMSEFPLRDVMPNVRPPAFDDDGFDPSESPDMKYRVGVDVSIALFTQSAAPDLTPAMKDSAACLIITSCEDFRLEIRGAGAPRGLPVGIRAYLVGTALKRIQ